MAVNLSPVWGAGAQLLDNSGNVLSGGKIYTYYAGTTTPAITFTSSSGATANSNPIILNSAGRVPYEIWLTDGASYKFVLKDSNDTLIGTWDNLVGINSNFVNYVNQQEIQIATAGQTVFTLTTMQYLPGTNSLSVYVDGVNQYGPGAQYAFVETDAVTVTFASGLHVGAEVKFTSTQTQNSGVADASQISYTYPSVDAVTESVEDRLAQYVSVKDFGAVGDGVTDDTTAIQTALDQSADKSIVFPYGTYLVSSLTISEYRTTIISEGATLLGKDTGSYTHVLRNNIPFTTIVGALIIDTQFNADYDCGLWVTSGYGKYTDITFRNTKLAIQVGTPNVNQVSLSEMSFINMTTHQCGRALDAHGIFTVVPCVNCIFVGGEHSTWYGIDFTTIRLYGAQLQYTGGQLHGYPSNTYPIIYAVSMLYDGSYYDPSVQITNLDCESAKPFLQMWNAAATLSIANRGKVLIENSRIDFYYSQLPTPGSQPAAFYFNNYYNGTFKTKNNAFWFDAPLTVRPVTIGSNTKAQVNWEDFARSGGYYGTNLATYTGLPPEIPFQIGLSVVMTNAYTCTDSSPVKFDTIQTGVQTQRLTLSDYYSTSTGKFTVPKGGLSTITIVANYTISSGLGSNPQAWIQHYSPSGGFTHQLSQCNLLNPNAQIVCMIPEAAEGDEISFITYSNSTGAVLDVSNPYNNQMTIAAYITTPNT